MIMAMINYINFGIQQPDNLYSITLRCFETYFERIILFLKGVRIGKNNKFYGYPKFTRARTASIKIGENCSFLSKHTSNLIGINRPCIISAIDNNASIIIGNNCGFSGTVIGCFNAISIGNNVRCGANTLISDGDWHQDDPRSGASRPIVIEDNVWLGEGVKVLKGVTIGKNSVIGVGSIVTKDIPANVIAAGNPCKVIRTISI